MLFGFSHLGFSQTSPIVSGKVTDSDNQPVAGANILVTGTNRGTVADAEGNFYLQFTEKGVYFLRFSAIGFETTTKKVETGEGRLQRLEVRMDPDDYQLQGVEITGRREDSYKNDVSFSGTKVATPIKDIPQSITFVTKELMLDQQSFTTGDVVKNLSGINQFSAYDDFTLRGFRSPNQLINGLRSGGDFLGASGHCQPGAN